MKRITIALTENEYANLEYTAQHERRTVREMAAYLTVKNCKIRPVSINGVSVSSGTLVAGAVRSLQTAGNARLEA